MNFLHLKEWEADWQEDNYSMSGHVVHRIEAYLPEGEQLQSQGSGDWTGNEVGYIKITYIPSNYFEEKYGGKVGMLRFADDFMGWLFRDPIVIPRAISEISRRIDSYHERVSRKEVQKMEMEERFDLFEDYMDRVVENYGGVREEKKEYHVDKPRVEYIQVADGYKRQGIGTQLYKEASRWMEEEFGLRSYSSTLRSDAAEAVWKSMVEDGDAEYMEDIDRYVKSS